MGEECGENEMQLIYKSFGVLDKSKYQFPFYVITNKTVSDGDWKTALIKKKPRIPKGTKLKITDMFVNFEGDWLVTEYEGFNYSVNPEDVDID